MAIPPSAAVFLRVGFSVPGNRRIGLQQLDLDFIVQEFLTLSVAVNRDSLRGYFRNSDRELLAYGGRR